MLAPRWSSYWCFAFALTSATMLGVEQTRAETFLWTPSTSGIVVEATALKQTKAGVTVRAQAYTVEYTSSTTKVFGPWPTRNGLGGYKIFGINVRRAVGEQLGLISQRGIAGIGVVGDDCCNPARPGFDSHDYVFPAAARTIKKLEMAVFGFSQAVRVDSVKVDDVSNFERDVWVAACSASSAPNFADGLTPALAACTIRNKNETGGGVFTHQVGLAGVRFLVVGARPRGTAIGRITVANPGGGQFYIDSISFTK